MSSIITNPFVYGTAPSYFLDTFSGPAPDHAYAFKKLTSSYSGSASRDYFTNLAGEADTGFDGTGDFDTATFNSNLGAGTASMRYWYDQIGSADLGQSSTSLQPQTGASSAHLNNGTGQYCLVTDGTADYLTLAANELGQYLDADAFCWALGKTDTGASYDFFFAIQIGSPAYYGAAFAHAGTSPANEVSWDRYNGGWRTAAGSSASNEATRCSIGCLYDHAGTTDMTIYKDATSKGTAAFTANSTSGTKDSYVGKSGSFYGKVRLEMLLTWSTLLNGTEISELEGLKSI